MLSLTVDKAESTCESRDVIITAAVTCSLIMNNKETRFAFSLVIARLAFLEMRILTLTLMIERVCVAGVVGLNGG